GNRKTIQSPAGGVVRKINVKEGDKVKAGEVLVQMSQVQAQAQVDSLKDQYYTTLATEGRLLAERDNLSKIRFSPVFDTLKDDPRVAEIIALQ
ncbi:HlyD family secretion protein, partial [Klebsiella pneumoniae]|nr:HlyD family secretion protein [Klebsiella pneumoniae]